MTQKFHFGQWLKKEIGKREKTVTAFAAETGISPARIFGLMETASPRTRLDTIGRLARGLGLTYEQVEARIIEASESHHATAA